MNEQLWITALLNKGLGKPVYAFLHALPRPFHPAHPEAPITNSVAMELVVVALLIVIFLLVRSRLSVERPGGVQHMAEMFHEFIAGQGEEIIGHHSGRFAPFLGALFLFILVSNLIGLIPGFESPTAS